MSPHERLRNFGWSERQIAALLGQCAAEEAIAVGGAESGDDLRKVLDAIEDRRNPPPEPDRVEVSGTVVIHDGAVGEAGKLESGWKYEEGVSDIKDEIE